ncbi:YolD-like family protein [Cytobacillus pseudoceanisediminis]|uniref:YolD-like family protein n=1 Tax=Cytobacillus pseudoceanisediminis TaxID=3051614 RepID=UPI003CFB8131
MTIRDRGMMKWQGAFFMPEHVKMLREIERDMMRVQKPLLDEYQIEEMERQICESMEFAQPVKLTVWHNGFTYDEIGRVHYLEPIHKEVRLKTELGTISRIKFADIITVEVIDKA